jgi:hypothetical protein
MSDTNQVPENWSRMVEQMNEAMNRSVEQNMEAQARFMEAWADTMEGSMPDEEEMNEAVESYGRAYEVWMDAAEEMFERINDASQGEEVSIAEFRDIWLRTANEAFKEVMETSAFAAATGNVVGATMEVQEQANEASQEALLSLGLPTRGDVEEVGERLVELERRQHAVEQKLDEIIERME